VFTGREFESTRKALDEIPTIDTHEHYGESWCAPSTDLYALFRDSYVGWVAHDAELAETPESLRAWLAPGWNNAYTVSMMRGLRGLYGMEERELDEIPFDELERKVSEAYQDPGWALGVIRRAGIAHSIVDPLPVPGYVHDEPTFHLALRSHMLVHGYDRAARDHGGDNPFAFAAKLGRNISSFDDYLEYVDFWVREHKQKGAVAIKSALAYERDIDVRPVTFQEAERIFDSGTRDPVLQKTFGDFILNLLAKKAAEYGLVFQIHAGLALQATSHPRRLMWLIESNPDTVFDLFHAGYPWLDDVLAMALERPNLIVDSCWLPIISPSAAVRLYTEYPEVAYRADTLLWGGDNWHAEETYGAALAFKDCLAKAVADKVEGGYWTRKEGLRFAEGVMWRAAQRWFGIQLC
jgi:predicted TIM-barrel fold metal-dependent hydrolase